MKVGDLVKVTDVSWSVSCVTMKNCVKPWSKIVEVVAVGCNLPMELSDHSNEKKYLGFPDRSYGPHSNDTIIKDEDGVHYFICSKFLKKEPEKCPHCGQVIKQKKEK